VRELTEARDMDAASHERAQQQYGNTIRPRARTSLRDQRETASKIRLDGND
jgi:hypothetical protein